MFYHHLRALELLERRLADCHCKSSNINFGHNLNGKLRRPPHTILGVKRLEKLEKESPKMHNKACMCHADNK